MTVTSTAPVMTGRGKRYRKHLASHFGHRIEVTQTPSSTVLARRFGGATTLTAEPDGASASNRTTARSG